jgi:hypothetical protein
MYTINSIQVTFEDNDPHTEQEAKHYLDYGLTKHPNLKALIVRRGEGHADLEYILPAPRFERIRRITGYLQKTEQWNSAKKAELQDRVKHTHEGR